MNILLKNVKQYQSSSDSAHLALDALLRSLVSRSNAQVQKHVARA